MKTEDNVDYTQWKYEHCIQAMNDYHKELSDLAEKHKKVSDRILKALLSVKGADWVSELHEYAKESEVHNPFEIVRVPVGKIQSNSEFPLIGKEWVDQKTGYECDDYYGTVSIQIDEKRWLQMPFQC